MRQYRKRATGRNTFVEKSVIRRRRGDPSRGQGPVGSPLQSEANRGALLLQRHVNSGAGWSTDSSGRASLRQLLALWYYRTPFHLRILKRHRVVPCVHRQSRGIKPLQARFGVSLGRLQEGEAALAIAPPPPRSAVHTPYSEELRTSSLIMSGSALDIGRVQPQFRERLSTDSSE